MTTVKKDYVEKMTLKIAEASGLTDEMLTLWQRDWKDDPDDFEKMSEMADRLLKLATKIKKELL